MNYYVATNDEEFSMQLDNFSNKIGGYAADFNLSTDDVDQSQKDSIYFAWAIRIIKRQDDTKKGWTGFKNNLRRNVPNVTTNKIPEPVDISPAPGEVPPGVQYRFTTLVNRIKAHNNYTKAIGQVLGIDDNSQNRVSIDDAQPRLRLAMNGGLVKVFWKKGPYEGIVIEKNTGAGFVVLDKDMHPSYTDTTPLPPANQSAVWKYRAMYLYKDAKVGLWSDVVSITVGD